MMRIFGCYSFDLKKIVSYQNTLPFLLDLMKKNGYQFNRTLFSFNQILDNPVSETREPLHMLQKQFQYLTRYPIYTSNDGGIEIKGMSNFPEIRGGELYISDNDFPAPTLLCDITAKIPKPCYLYSSAVILDNINWITTPNPQPATELMLENCPNSSYMVKASDGDCNFYMSNCIILDKRFDWGTRFNPVHVRIELTSKDGQKLLDPAPVLANLTAALGEPYDRSMMCTFPYKQRREIYHKLKTFIPFFDRKRKVLKALALPSSYVFGDSCYLSGNAEKTGHFSVPGSSSFFKKALASIGFIYKNPDVDCCQYAKILPNNHCISLDVGGSKNKLFISLTCMGYNFQVFHLIMNVFVSSLSNMTLLLQDALIFLQFWEREIAPELYRLFGETPSWYKHSSMMYMPHKRLIQNETHNNYRAFETY